MVYGSRCCFFVFFCYFSSVSKKSGRTVPRGSGVFFQFSPRIEAESKTDTPTVYSCSWELNVSTEVAFQGVGTHNPSKIVIHTVVSW